MTDPKRKTRSGTVWTDADYQRAGYARLGLRIPADVRERLQQQAKARKTSIAKMIGAWSKREDIEP